MATITLRKAKFDGIQGILNQLKANFKDYEASLNELRKTAEGVGSDTCDLEDAIDAIASSSESEKDKVEKIQKLNEKIEAFVNTAVQREKKVRDKIVEKKKDFYQKYSHLKPDCEKNIFERAYDKGKEIVTNVVRWVVDHIDIIIAAIIVLAAIAVCIFCPAAIAVFGAIAAGISAITGIVDLVCMALTGDDFGTWLGQHGPVGKFFGKVWRGVSIGCDIASIILPAGALLRTAIKDIGKVGLKSFAKSSLKGIAGNFKTGLKNFGKGCKEFLHHPLKQSGKILKSVLGIDDIENLGKLKELKLNNSMIRDGEIYSKVLQDGNFDSFAKYSDTVDVDKAIDKTMSNLTLSDTHKSVNTKMRNNLQGEFIDKTIEKISSDKAFAKSFKEATGIDTSLRGIRNPNTMTKTQFKNELKRCGYTLHEDFDRSIVQIVPKKINSSIFHNGGTARAVDSIFDADSRGLGSVYRDIGNGNKVRVDSIYGGANYAPKKYAKAAIEQYNRFEYQKVQSLSNLFKKQTRIGTFKAVTGFLATGM